MQRARPEKQILKKIDIYSEKYVDEILDISNPDRCGWMLIGDNSNPTRPGPNSDDSERFVYMAFIKDGGGTDGTMNLIAIDNDDSWTSFTTVDTGLNLDQWYNIRVDLDLYADTYDVYVDDVYKMTLTSRITKDSVTHISFAQWDTGAGTFYVDNISATTVQKNNAPTIENEFPSNGLTDVSISLSQIFVHISDIDGDLLNYTIVTEPDIGSQDNFTSPGETGGVKTCNVSGLTYGTTYSWYVNVSDGEDLTRKTYYFETQTAPDNPPIHDTPILTSELHMNTTNEDLICTNQSTSDPDGDQVYNTFHWYKDGSSLTNLTLSFNSRNLSEVKDYSGYENSGTIHGASWTSDGIVGGAYNYDGYNNYIQIPDNSSLDGNGSWNEMTIEHWIYRNPGSVGGRTISKYFDTSVNNRSYQIYIGSSSNKIYGAVTRSGNSYISVPFNIPLNTDEWYHVVLTYRSNDSIAIYVNGEGAVQTTDHNGTIQASPGIDVYIGSRSGSSNFFDGKVDEVNIYPIALSAEQIYKNYIQSKDGFSNNSTIVSKETHIGEYWKCEITPSDLQLDGITKPSNDLIIIDTLPPEITNIAATPPLTSQGGFVNITCTILDNVAVDKVNVSISGPAGFTPINSTMNPGYFYNNTYSIPGIYDYLIWTNDKSGNENSSIMHHFKIQGDYSISLNESWNLISLPVNESISKTDIVISYNGDNYIWQDAIDNNIILGFIYGWNKIDQGYDFIDILQPGEGYWMYAYLDCNLVFSSDSIKDEYITNLSVKWNLVSSPNNISIAKEDITFYYEGTNYTWQQAVDNNTILGFIYGWNKIDQGYDFIDILQPGEGYWMYAYYNCTLFYYL